MVTQLLNDQCDSSTAGLTLGLAVMASGFIQGHPLIGFHSDLGGRPGGPPVLLLLAEGVSRLLTLGRRTHLCQGARVGMCPA